ncbi:MAG: hypothetical protein SGJ04_07965 [Bacteroidota bacterium]|nr:hypothetical protein [Bacteroidota bacterium]
MKLASIKIILEKYSAIEIATSIAQLDEGENSVIQIEGDDEGDLMTHLLAAEWIINEAEKNRTEIKVELRNYTARVRKSIN